jgi:Protein of unknwon function (DUF3310)
MSALDEQVGGDHYRKMKVQPIEFILANNIPYTEGCIIKYICRWRDKGGIKDLQKIKHYCDLLIESLPKEEDTTYIVIGCEKIPLPVGYRVLNKDRELIGPGVLIWTGNGWNDVSQNMYGLNPISVCTYICPTEPS